MWDKIETFYYIAKVGNLTKAGEQLNLSQSALSRSIQSLERTLGCQLFQRVHHGVVLTPQGKDVFHTAQTMVMYMNALRQQLFDPDALKGRIRIATTYAIANYILARPLFEFYKMYPDIEFDIFCNDQQIDIIQNEVDIAIRPALDDPDEHFTQIYLLTLQAKLFASDKYISIYGEPKTLEDMANHKFVVFSRPETLPYSDTEWFLKLNGIQNSNQVALRVNTVELQLKAAIEGLGIIPSYEQMDHTKDAGLRHIMPEIRGPKIDVYLIHSKHLGNLARISTLKNFLIDKLNQIPNA
jgi:DNA-binding transcriptional LysR family regulator